MGEAMGVFSDSVEQSIPAVVDRLTDSSCFAGCISKKGLLREDRIPTSCIIETCWPIVMKMKGFFHC